MVANIVDEDEVGLYFCADEKENGNVSCLTGLIENCPSNVESLTAGVVVDEDGNGALNKLEELMVVRTAAEDDTGVPNKLLVFGERPGEIIVELPNIPFFLAGVVVDDITPVPDSVFALVAGPIVKGPKLDFGL